MMSVDKYAASPTICTAIVDDVSVYFMIACTPIRSAGLVVMTIIKMNAVTGNIVKIVIADSLLIGVSNKNKKTC